MCRVLSLKILFSSLDTEVPFIVVTIPHGCSYDFLTFQKKSFTKHLDGPKIGGVLILYSFDKGV